MSFSQGCENKLCTTLYSRYVFAGHVPSGDFQLLKMTSKKNWLNPLTYQSGQDRVAVIIYRDAIQE